MSRNVNDIIRTLSSAQRKKVEARRGKGPWHHPGQRFAP